MKTISIPGIVLLAFVLLLINTGAQAGAENNPHDNPVEKIIADDAKEQTHDTNSDGKKEKQSDDMRIEGHENKEEAGTQDIEKQQKEDEAPKNKFTFINPSRKEYIALFIGYGGYFPVADYGKECIPAHMVSFTAGVYCINFLGLSPEVHIRYAKMDYKEDPVLYRASLSQVQVYPAIIYRYPIQLPRNFLTMYGRIWDGLSRVAYESQDPYFPAFKKNIVENINIFGLSAGCCYDVWRGFLVGVDLSYSIVSTARKPLQSLSLMVNVGWRIL